VDRGRDFRRYPLLRRKGLLRELDAVAKDPTEARILSFASRWGALATGIMLVPRSEAGVANGTLVTGQSLTTWRNELMRFGDLRRLWQAVVVLSAPDAFGPLSVRDAERLLAGSIRWTDDGGCLYVSRFEAAGAWSSWHESVYRVGDERAEIVGRYLADRDSLKAARFLVHRDVNRKMRGVISPSVLPFMGSVIRFFPESLLAAAWLLFARELAGSAGSERECEGCRLPFIQGRRDQRFCSKSCQEASAYRRRGGRTSRRAGVSGTG
jgi:hypothetical protein